MAQLFADLPWYWKSGVRRVSLNHILISAEYMSPCILKIDKRNGNMPDPRFEVLGYQQVAVTCSGYRAVRAHHYA